jgi:hypothetical protein
MSKALTWLGLLLLVPVGILVGLAYAAEGVLEEAQLKQYHDIGIILLGLALLGMCLGAALRIRENNLIRA